MTTIIFCLYAMNLARTKVSQSVIFIFEINKLHKISKLQTNMITKKSKTLKSLGLSQAKQKNKLWWVFFVKTT